MEFMWLVAGFVTLIVGAELLVRGASSLAISAGMSPLIVGLTIVAFGTSSPELVVSIDAASKQSGGIVFGNIIGSNICNLALILGVGSLLKPIPVHHKLVRADIPVAILATICFVIFTMDQTISQFEAGILTFGLFLFIAGNIYSARRNPDSDEPEDRVWPWPISSVMIVLGLIGLIYGSDWLVESATTIARDLGISDTLIGLTLLAIGTSLPELATTVVAAKNDQLDLAIGNAVGSNIFNIFCVVGITGVIQPFSGPDIQTLDLAVMTALPFILLPLLLRGMVLSRWDGAGLLVIYAMYLAVRI